jgi:outer membrane protein assembly factor BamA
LAPAGDDVTLRDVLVRVEEGQRWQLSYGAGYDSETGPNGLVGLAYSNVAGRASTIRLDVRASPEEERYRVLFQDRSPRASRLPFNYSVYHFTEPVSVFESRRFGAQFEASFLLGADTKFSLFYDYRISELIELGDGPVVLEGDELPEDVQRELTEAFVSSITPTLIIDRRDDPVEPNRGFGATFQVEGAFPLLSADEELLRGFAQGARYLRLGRFGTAALGLRLGAITSLEPALEDQPDVNRIAISERYFAGGHTTHRAYGRDELGIPGETIVDETPVGGNGLLLVNFDYRFPIVGKLGGTLFVDGGNVWRRPRDVDLGELKWGIGVGLRYLSPIGPLRVEAGFKLNREPFEDSMQIHVSFGNPF